MNSGRYDQVMETFLAASQLSGEARQIFLEQACTGDDALRREVESLLKHHQQHTISTKPQLSASWETVKPPQRRIAKAKFRHGLSEGTIRPLVSAGILTVSLVVVGYWLSSQIQSTLRAGLAEHLQYSLAANVAALRDWVGEKQAEVESWASHARVRESIVRLAEAHAKSPLQAADILSSPDYVQLLELLAPVYNRKDSFGIGVVSRDGVNLAHSRAELLGADLVPENSIYLQRVTLGETVLAQPSLDPGYVVGFPIDLEEPRMAVVAPVFDEAKHVVAALSFAFSASNEFADLLSAKAGENAESFIVNDKGVLLSSLAKLQPLRSSGLLGAADGAPLNVELRDPGVDLTVLTQSSEPDVIRPLTMMATAVAAHQDGMNLDGYRNVLGQTVVGAWQFLPEYGFAVATEIEHAEAYAALRYVKIAFRLLFAIVMLLALALVYSSGSWVKLRNSLTEARKLGQYTLLSLIGQGGMGKVYLAQHALLQRPTALKIFDGENADSASVERFEREVQLTSQLAHPNTIQIYDFGRTEENVFYYAMEYLDGLNLAELVARKGPLPPGRVIHILRQVCGSLKEAHERGLIHRDVKPANIMICRRGGIGDVVKVLDFGLVKELVGDDRVEQTRGQQIGGTPRYMAPERVTAPREVDARSDLYSLGAVAYFLITGEEVFGGHSPLQVLALASQAAAPQPSHVRHVEVPDALNDIVVRCLAPQPSDRPASAAVVGELLEGLSREWPWSSQEAERWWAENLPSGRQTVAAVGVDQDAASPR